MIAESTTTKRQDQVETRRLWRAGLVAIIGAIAANLIVYFVATRLFGLELVVPTVPQPVTALPVILTSSLGAIGGTVVLAALARWTRRPLTIFQIVALVFLIISLVPLLGPGIASGVRVTLLTMHVVAAIATVGSLTLLARR